MNNPRNPNQHVLTPFQILALELICLGNPNEEGIDKVIDIDQLLDRLALRDRETTKASIQFMVRALIFKEMIEKKDVGKRRSYKRVGYIPTRKGLDVAGPREVKPAFHEPEASFMERLLT